VNSVGDLSANSIASNSLRNIGNTFTVSSLGDLSANSLVSNSLRNIDNSFSVNSVGDLSANSLTIAGFPLSYYINTGAAINSDISGDLIVAGVSRLNGGINVNSGKLITDTSGNLTTLGTLSIGGTPSTTFIGGTSLATLLSSAVATTSTVTGDLTVGGLSRLNGGINVNTGKLTVTSAGDLSANSLHTVGDRFYVTSAGDLSANSLTSNSLRNSGNSFYVTSAGDLSANSLHTVDDRFYVTSDGDLSANSLHTVGDQFYVTSAGDLSANSLHTVGDQFYVTSAGDLSANSLHTVGDQFYVTSAGDLSANSLHTVGDRFYVTSAGDLSANSVTSNSLRNSGNTFYVTSAGDLSANSLHTVGDRFYVTSLGDLSANSICTKGKRFAVTSAGDLSANSLHTVGDSFVVTSTGAVSTNNGTIQLLYDSPKDGTLVVIGDPLDGASIIRGDGSIQLNTVYLSSENGIFSANGIPVVGSRSFTTDLSASGISNFNGRVNLLSSGNTSVSYNPTSKTLSVSDTLTINNGGSFTATAGSSSINVGSSAVKLTNATATNLICSDGATGNTPGGVALAVTQGPKAYKPIMTVGNMSGVTPTNTPSFAMNGNMYVNGSIVCTGNLSTGKTIGPALATASVDTIDISNPPFGFSAITNRVVSSVPNTPYRLSNTATLADVINAVNILITNQNNLIAALKTL
jgi:glucan-binding YG repeat protein